MSRVERVGSLEVAQDLHFQQWQWTIQRHGWIVLLALVAAALAGLLGRGPLSSAATATPDGALHLEYDRFLHYRDPTTLQLRLEPQGVRDGLARVWLEGAYLEGVQIQHVTPRPVAEEAAGGSIVFVFRVADPGRATRITFHLEAEQLGRLSGRFGLDGGEPGTFWQFVYP